MNSNYMFAFNRGRQMGPPAPRSLDAPGSLGPVPRSLDAPGPNSLNPGNRFSINRLINYKSAGGCRSCN